MNDEYYNNMKIQYKLIIDEIDDNIENLIYLLKTVEIENINLYQFYLSLNDLINKKSIIENKIKMYKIENNIIDDELFVDE